MEFTTVVYYIFFNDTFIVKENTLMMSLACNHLMGDNKNVTNILDSVIDFVTNLI